MDEKRPVIGVTSPASGGHLAWWATRLAVWRAGGRAVRLFPDASDVIPPLAGLVLSGGQNIHPRTCGLLLTDDNADQDRDTFELAMLERALDQRVPILGICRGAQLINVALGGTLERGIPAPKNTPLPAYRVHLAAGSLLRCVVRRDELMVNGLHTQAVRQVAPDLRAVAWDETGVIQAVEHVAHAYCVGVQWHPEYLPYQGAHQRLFQSLVDASRPQAVSPRLEFA